MQIEQAKPRTTQSTGEFMEALLWADIERMEMVRLERPAPAAGQILVQVHTVGICGSELEGFLGHNSLRRPPLLMGHEFSGTIAAVGDAVEWLAAGDRVTVNPLTSCGSCSHCRRGLPNLCGDRRIVGIHGPGAFAEFVVVDAGQAIPLSSDLPLVRAALAEPLACSLRAARRALSGAVGSNVAVIGAGAIGLLCARVAQIMGAARVVISDKNASRLDIARKAGIAHTLEAGGDDLPDRVREIAGPEGVDVVIDAAGFQPTRSCAMALLNNGGTFMNIGLGIDDTTLPINLLTRSEIRILGSFAYTPDDFRAAVQLLADGRVTEAGWTREAPLAYGTQAFPELVAGEIPEAKILLHPGAQ